IQRGSSAASLLTWDFVERTINEIYLDNFGLEEDRSNAHLVCTLDDCGRECLAARHRSLGSGGPAACTNCTRSGACISSAAHKGWEARLEWHLAGRELGKLGPRGAWSSAWPILAIGRGIRRSSGAGHR